MQKICDKTNLEKFQNGMLQDDELIVFTDHLLYCKDCNDAFLQCFESESEALSPPRGFSESVLRRTKSKNRAEFIKYCVKVSAAACFALSVLFSGIPEILLNFGNRTFEEGAANQANLRLEEFINTIFNREAEHIDKAQ